MKSSTGDQEQLLLVFDTSNISYQVRRTTNDILKILLGFFIASSGNKICFPS